MASLPAPVKPIFRVAFWIRFGSPAFAAKLKPSSNSEPPIMFLIMVSVRKPLTNPNVFRSIGLLWPAQAHGLTFLSASEITLWRVSGSLPASLGLPHRGRIRFNPRAQPNGGTTGCHSYLGKVWHTPCLLYLKAFRHTLHLVAQAFDSLRSYRNAMA